ncbi:MAG: alpha/beta hydrolase [Rhodobacteraceae bacterium]|nr:MAG: alpha/beta hydrolase [Paracoccaceae bacterium]
MSGLIDPGALTAPPSAETADFNRWLRETLAAIPQAHEVPVEVVRQARAEGKGPMPLGGPHDPAFWRDAPTPLGRVRVSPPLGESRGAVLHLHGGGWTFNAPDYYDAWNLALAREAGVTVLSAPYRLAPEHRWPACADDAEAAALWLLEQASAFGGGVAIIGESSGAHLAAVTLLRLKARGLVDRVAGAALTYGAFDLRMTPSMAAWGDDNLILSTPVVDWFIDNLTAGDRALRADPAVSPLLADLSGLPPCLLTCGTADALLDDTLFMACRLAAAGAAVETRIVPGGCHAFDLFDIAIAREHHAALAAFVRARLDAAAT